MTEKRSLEKTADGDADARHKEKMTRNKYWAPVNRVDNAWGDRNLFCACPPLEVNGHDGEM